MLSRHFRAASRLQNLARHFTMAATANGTTTSVHTNGTSNGATPPKIHLYTNHSCPYAHRAHIALQELNLPFEETIIDLNTPRPQWYLDINPRGKYGSVLCSQSSRTYLSCALNRRIADSISQASCQQSSTPFQASWTRKSSQSQPS